MTTLHILSSPFSPVNLNNRIDPFSPIVFKYIDNLTRLGWNCIHYGLEGCQVNCETVICLEHPKDNVRIYNSRAASEISRRKQPGDFILCFYGTDNLEAANQNKDLIIVEPSIGYDAAAVFAPFKVFASYAQMHYYYGKTNQLMSPSWNDRVIYNAISKDEFEYCEDKEDYFLYFGRIIETKGIEIAIKATEMTNQNLLISGPGNIKDLGYEKLPSHVEFLGPSDLVQRKKLMSKAKAILGPTLYIEPFGNMIVEGFMSGTPAITTDWGGFTETVLNGITGYRCRSMIEFANAIDQIDRINPKNCRDWALNNCEDSVVHKKHNDYLKSIQYLHRLK